MTEKGFAVEQSEFHRYDTPTGELIMKWLKGEYDVCQQTIEYIMTADKQAQQEYFKELINNKTDYLILDRYTTSQRVYGKANGINEDETIFLQKHMLKPNIEILFDIDPATSMMRKGKHNNGQNDRYESDLNLLTKVRKEYLNHFILRHSQLTEKIIIDGQKEVNDVEEELVKQITPYIK